MVALEYAGPGLYYFHFDIHAKLGLHWLFSPFFEQKYSKPKLFFLRFYLFIHKRDRERGRDIGRGRTRPPTWKLMPDARITTWAKGRRSTTEPPRHPDTCVFLRDLQFFVYAGYKPLSVLDFQKYLLPVCCSSVNFAYTVVGFFKQKSLMWMWPNLFILFLMVCVWLFFKLFSKKCSLSASQVIFNTFSFICVYNFTFHM